MDQGSCFPVQTLVPLPTADVMSSDMYPLSDMRACWGCEHAVGVCGHSCVFRRESRLQTVATGKSRSTLSCILKCVTLRLMRQRLIGLGGIQEWRVSDGLKGIQSVCELCLVLCVCVLARVRDTGKHCDMSGWHPVKASWQHVVMLSSGNHTAL